MKTPRVEDFDPKAATKLKSSLDDMPAILPPSVPTRFDSAVPAAKLDAIPSQKPGKPGNQKAGNPGLRELGKPAPREAGNPGIRETGNPDTREADSPGLDLSQVPLRKETFMFTDEESDALEDVKIELRRKFDLKGWKNDIARIAVDAAIDDYRKRGAESTLVQALRKRQR